MGCFAKTAVAFVCGALFAWTPPAAAKTDYVCPENATLDPYEIWEGINNSDEATTFLRQKIIRMNEDEIITWFVCQGFRVDRNLIASRMFPGKKDTLIAAYYYVGWERSPLWDNRWIRYPPVYVHSISILIDPIGKLRRADASNTIE